MNLNNIWEANRQAEERRELLNRVRRQNDQDKRTTAIIAFSGGFIIAAILTKLLLKK